MLSSLRLTHGGSMAPRSKRVLLSRSSSLPGHSDSPNVHDRLLPVSSGLQAAVHRWSVVKKNSDDPAETPGSQVSFSCLLLRMPLALLRVLDRCSSPLLPCQHRPSPQSYGVGEYPTLRGFVPQPDSPGNRCPALRHEAAPFV
jgi:hypothetical protein